MIVSIYAAVLALMFLALSIRIILVRRKVGIAIGSGSDQVLTRAVRVHSNFAEYVPLVLILIFLFEFLGGPALVVHGLGAALLIGRSIHAYGVSQLQEKLTFRVTGMLLTFLVIIISSLGILYLHV